MLGSIINFFSSLLNITASINNTMEREAKTEKDIKKDNKDINEGNVNDMAMKIHEFTNVCPLDEEKKDEKTTL